MPSTDFTQQDFPQLSKSLTALIKECKRMSGFKIPPDILRRIERSAAIYVEGNEADAIHLALSVEKDLTGIVRNFFRNSASKYFLPRLTALERKQYDKVSIVDEMVKLLAEYEQKTSLGNDVLTVRVCADLYCWMIENFDLAEKRHQLMQKKIRQQRAEEVIVRLNAESEALAKKKAEEKAKAREERVKAVSSLYDAIAA